MEKQREEKGWKRFLLPAAIALLGYLSVRYLLFILLPLGLGWILSFYLQRPVGFLCTRMHFRKGFASALLVILTLGLLVAVLGLAGVKLWEEAEGVGKTLSQMLHGVMKLADGLLARLDGFLDLRVGSLRDKLPEIAMGIMEQAAGALPAMVAQCASAVPGIVIGFVVFSLSAFYFSRDFHSVNRKVMSCFSPKISRLISEFKNQFLLTVAGYLKAYLFLLVLSFTQLYFGLTVLRVEYAFSVALLIAVIDILPVLGMGVVVIPWALWSALSGNYSLALGLLILFAVMSVVRQIAEPKVVGEFIGLHPLLSLVCVCVGLRFLGVLGMFFVPMLVIILKNLAESGHLHLFSEE